MMDDRAPNIYLLVDKLVGDLVPPIERREMSFERIHWTMHALRILRDRSEISYAEVEAAIRAPHQVVPDARQPGRWIAQKLMDVEGRPMLLRVVYTDAGGGEVSVLSFYRTVQVPATGGPTNEVGVRP